MSYLITSTEFATFRDISQKLDEGKINESIGLAQQSDLIEILGDFYFDVVKNALVAEWLPLMDGSTFTYCDDEFEHAGIKKMLADYTMARFVLGQNKRFTPFGYVSKKSDDSEIVDYKAIKDDAKQAQVDAGIKFKFIEKYILSESVLFERYCKNKSQGTSFFTQKFSKL